MDSKQEKLLRQKTAELQKELAKKNRDLEIEASLERVRTVAMSMRAADDLLNICKILFEELTALGFGGLRNAMINIVNDENGSFLNYDFRVDDGGSVTPFLYNSHPVMVRQVEMTRSASDAFFEHVLTGDDLEDFKAFRVKNGEPPDPKLENVTTLYYYFYSIGVGSVGISAFSSLPEEKREVLKRFRNVFDLAYRRYADIEQAEAQAKEAQIEASLERVRAVAMSMRQSEELINVCETLYKELSGLGFSNIRNAQIAINNDEKQTYSAFEYAAYGKNIKEASYDTHKLLQEIEIEVKGSKEALSQKQITGHELDDWRAWRKRIGLLTDERLEQANAMCFYLYSIGMGMLGISTYDAITADQLETLKRFKNVCELAYRRYADVALAEAQAREAQIELGLERVRARAMAMQSSNELADLVATVFDELTKLDFALSWCIINIIDESTLVNSVWVANLENGRAPESFQIQFADYPFPNAMKQAWKERRSKWVYELKGKEKQVYHEFLFNETEFGRIPEAVKAALRAQELQVASFTFSNFGGLQTTSTAPLSEESLDILSRFGKVFDLTYTRFNDLKQAEEQAREAQIELALERVRARTMAMQYSDELAETAYILFQQFKELGENPDQATIGIINEDEHVIEYWVTMYGSQINKVFKFSIDEPNVTHKIYQAWKTKKKSLVIDLSGKALYDFTTYRSIMGGAAFNPDEKRRVINVAFFSKGIINVQSTDARSAESVRLLERFAGVFDGTYTRFLDLKKAEAQVRESQIQLALERVRARTMAMQRSDELPETANLLFKQVQELGMPAWSAGYCNWTDNKKAITFWMSSEGVLQQPFSAPTTKDPSFIHMREAAERGETFYMEEVGGKALVKHYQYMRTLPVVGEVLDSIINAGHPLPAFQIFHLAYFAQGFLLFITYEPVPEAHEVFKRFAKVFEQTYTRFLDLQKAEAQARESQIELALERVRARTMAMYHSEELAETASVLFEQLSELGSEPARISIGIMDQEKEVVHFWATDQEGDQINISFTAQLSEKTTISKMYAGWQAKLKSLSIELDGKELAEWVRFCREEMGIVIRDELLKNRRVHTLGYFPQGWINYTTHTPPLAETTQILERFATMFSYTYTRFLDLQKAEAQARESQIQLALERVRARTMAMHRSEELAETALLLFQQLQELGLSFFRTGFYIWRKGEDLIEGWTSNGVSDGILPPILLPFKEDDGHRGIYEASLKGQATYEQVLGGDELMRHYEWLMAQPTAPMTFDRFKASGLALPHTQYKYAAIFKGGYLLMIATEPQLIANDLLKRFAKVFEQTYTRFLDLQKAEAQAREGQIQLALERVRAKTMAMQHSNELLETSQVVFHQLRDLGETADQIGIAIVRDDEGVFDLFATLYGNQMVQVFHPKIDDPFVMGKVYKNWKAHKKSFVVELGGEELRQYNILRNLLGGRNYYNEAIGPDDRWIVNAASFSTGILSFSSSTAPTIEATQLLERFAAVFDQTYTRFLDLQKAEAQARESQIEAALERVRSRTMGMQKSEELKEIIKVVYEQFVHLNILAEHAGFIMDYQANDDMHIWLADKHFVPSYITIPYFDSPHWNSFIKAKEKGEDFFVNHLDFEVKNKFYRDLFELVPGVTDEAREYYFNCPGLAGSTVLLENVGLYIENFSGTPFTDEENNTLMRFGKVFQQTYTRFLDLQKAETQAREAKIEAALERTRTQSMLMQHSTELDDTLRVFHQQVLLLGIRSAFSFLWLPDEEKDRHIFWAAWAENAAGQVDKNTPGVFKSKAIDYPLDRNEPATAQCLIDWKSNEPVYSYRVPPDAVANYFAAWQELIDGVEQLKPEYFRDGLYYVEAFMKYGCFGVIVESALAEDEKKILGRFAIEFERAYTRFLDLQKAEAQAREAQIELSLERVRASAMAMHKTDQLLDAAELLYKELTGLGINSMAVTYSIMAADEKSAAYYSINPVDGKVNPVPMDLPHTETKVMRSILSSWKKQEAFSKLDLDEKATLRHQTYVAGKIQAFFATHNFDYNFSVEAFLAVSPKKAVIYTFNFAQGYIFIIGGEHLTKLQEEMVMRFTKVFEMTYRRFLDLKQAEEQARESQIQLGLERVRAKAMAMQTSEELNDLIGTVFGELTKLDFVLTRCLIMIFYPETKASRWWMANSELPAEPMNYLVQNHKNPAYDAYLKAWKERLLKWRYVLKGKVKRDWDNFLFVDTELAQLPEPVIEGMKAPEQVLLSASFNNFGCLTLVTLEPLSDEHSDIMLRFAKVFDMCYTRFNDLKQAEEQARESQVQLALERVRARTMAMQKSEELPETSSLLFQQLKELGETAIQNSIAIVNEEAGFVELSTTVHGSHLLRTLNVPIDDPHLMAKAVAAWKAKQKSLTVEFEGQELKDYNDRRNSFSETKTSFPEDRWIVNISFFSKGWLSFSSNKNVSSEITVVQKRFAAVFDQTYTRFLDLQKAEAQARDAVKQASVDRVRGEIASMRTTKDLERIIPLVWNELTILNVPFIRCGVFIVDEAAELIHTHLSTPDGKALAAFDLAFDSEGIGRDVLPAWRKNKMAVIHWNAEEFAAYTQNLVDLGTVKSAERYVTEHPDTSLDLHFFPFLQGMLYVGNTEPLTDDAKDLVQSLADAFSTAYARYEDFNKLDVAKQQVDKTLTDLKAAQTQLIQTEKMASLGELTAGIAHEIQNPLNFVNNFSEVNTELIDEMQEEIDKGNYEEVKALANDIKGNQQKINMHGKRADGIVKGMLQHSQSGSGVKELTNINSVADEYMRLAYHGLRAKDKSFNAEMVTNFDPDLPKINVIGQDIGRVILNLFNNAFYAVNKKSKAIGANYKPTVEVSTGLSTPPTIGGGGGLIISVKDNGIGMPEDIKEKIMQPFFTTKPTGEGTGLGLSLTYDMVVKGHGGSIDVNSVEGEGSEFIITLPIN